MSSQSDLQLEPRMVEALEELAQSILDRFPTSTFRVSQGEEPDEVWLWIYADADDPEVVTDVVIDRRIDLHVDEGLFITMLPHSRRALAAQFGPRTDEEYAAMEWVPSQPLHVRVPTGS